MREIFAIILLVNGIMGCLHSIYPFLIDPGYVLPPSWRLRSPTAWEIVAPMEIAFGYFLLAIKKAPSVVEEIVGPDDWQLTELARAMAALEAGRQQEARERFERALNDITDHDWRAWT